MLSSRPSPMCSPSQLSRALACVLTMSLAGCGSGSRRTEPVIPSPEIRYLPSPTRGPCLVIAPPLEPSPPETCPDDIPDCSILDVYGAALLDHEELLERWARMAWRLCGPVTP